MDAAIPTSKEQVLAYVRRALAPGALYHGAIKAFLATEDYDEAWSDAIVWYMENMGQVKQSTIALSAGVVEYDVPADMDRLAEFIPPGSDYLGVAYTGFGFENQGFPVSGALGAEGMPMSDIANGLQQVETLQGLLGTGPYAEFDAVRRKLLTNPSGMTGTATLRYVSNELTFSVLPIRHRRWIRGYTLASAKKRLGTVLTRYESIEAASGAVSLTARLNDDAELEIQALQSDISQAIEPDLIYSG